jgi:hypothetical protein
MNASTSPLRQLTDRAHDEHVDDAAAAGERLLSGLALLPGEAGDAEHYVRTAEHVLLGHLDDAPSLSRLLDEVPPAAAEAAVARARLALQLAADLRALEDCPAPPAVQVGALYNAALALTRRADWHGVAARMEAAASIAERHAGDAAVQRAHAAMQNNIAGDMRYYLQPEHRADTAKVQTMLDAAARAREAWARAGGWMEVERAEYQLALCHAAAGLGAQAVKHAQACLSICEANGADACERFFAYEALAHAQRSAGESSAARAMRERMAALLPQIDDEGSRSFAQQALQALGA